MAGAAAPRSAVASRAAAPGSAVASRAAAPGSGRAATAAVTRIAAAGQSGQATVELVALLPLLLAVALAAAALLAGHVAGEHAGQAAQAGAMALLQDGDARQAALAALPREARAGATVEVDGRRVTVRVRPRLPIAPLAATMSAAATADAGPEPSP